MSARHSSSAISYFSLTSGLSIAHNEARIIAVGTIDVDTLKLTEAHPLVNAIRDFQLERQVDELMNSSITSPTRPVVALLTDFGLADGDVGIVKGVIAGIRPEIQIIDISHEIAPQNVAAGAWILASAYHYFPAETVFVCVIDPGVGSTRAAIALHAGNWFFVGPDNGLFSYVLQEQTVHGAVELLNPAYRLRQVSSTFHGRDIFAPAGAYLAGHASKVFPQLGPGVDPARLSRLPTLNATRRGSTIEGYILHVDNFGNLITSIPLSMVPELFSAEHVQVTFPGREATVSQRRRFFADGADDGQAFIYSDSSGYMGLAVRNSSASRTLGVGYGATMTFDTSAR